MKDVRRGELEACSKRERQNESKQYVACNDIERHNNDEVSKIKNSKKSGSGRGCRRHVNISLHN